MAMFGSLAPWLDQATTRVGDALIKAQNPNAQLAAITPEDRRAQIGTALLSLGGNIAAAGQRGVNPMAALGQGVNALQQQGVDNSTKLIYAQSTRDQMDRLKRADEQGSKWREWAKANAGKFGEFGEFLPFMDAETGMKALVDIYEKRQPKLTDDQREYLQAKEEGYTGTFLDFDTARRQASAARTNINNVPARAEGKFQEELGKGLADRFQKMAEEGDAARGDLAVIGQLRDVMPKGGTLTGISGMLAQYGIGGEGLSDIQATEALLARLTPQQRVPGSGATSDFEMRMFRSALPSLWRTPEGNEILLNTMEGLARLRQAQGDIAYRVMSGELTREQAADALKSIPDPMAAFKAYQRRTGGAGRQGARGDLERPQPRAMGPARTRYSGTGPNGEKIVSDDGSTWFDATTGERVQ